MMATAPHSQKRAPLRKEWASASPLPCQGPLVSGQGQASAVAITGSHHPCWARDPWAAWHSYLCTHSHHPPNRQFLEITPTQESEFKVELTSESSKDDISTLEGFPVDGSGTIFLVFLLGDPHLLKGVQRGKDRTTGVEDPKEQCERVTPRASQSLGHT